MARENRGLRTEMVNIREMMEKVQSKRDVYNFLTQECEAYLPKMDTVNIFFLKQIMQGTKEVSMLVAHGAVCGEVGTQGRSSATDRGADH